MSNKIVKIILIASIFILVSSIFFFFYSRSRKVGIVPETEKQESEESKALPIGEKFEDKYVVSDRDNSSEIKENFEKFLKESRDTSGENEMLQWVEIKDASGKIVNLGKFTESSGLFINPNLWNILDKNNFSLFYCPGGIGILINAELKGEYYNNAVKFTKEWESNMVYDVRSVIFSNLNLNLDNLKSQNLKFRDISRGRVVDFKDEKGILNHLYYKIIDDSIFLTNSLECFDQASNGLESNDP